MVPTLETGAVIAGRYRLERPLGEGGIGVVWEAWQTGVERRVAVKFLKLAGSREMLQRFEVEARALGRLNHPNCVTVHDFGQTESGMAFLAMEYLDGEPATAWRGRRLTIRDVIDIGQQIATALHYAHHHGVVHRDLKPENVFAVSTLGGDRLIKVLDFGLAKLTGQGTHDITKTGEVFGTPAYMSPEQLRGTRDAGAESDLYSLGVMLYELLEGRLPFREETPLELGMAHITKPVPPLRRAGVPEQLATIIHTLLAKDPSARYPDALALFDALDGVETDGQQTTLQLVISTSPHETTEDLGAEFARAETLARTPAVATTEPGKPPVDGSAETPRYEPGGTPLELADVEPQPGAPSARPASLPEQRKLSAPPWGVLAGGLVGAALVAALLWPERPPTGETGEAEQPSAPTAEVVPNGTPGDRPTAVAEQHKPAHDAAPATDQPASQEEKGETDVQDERAKHLVPKPVNRRPERTIRRRPKQRPQLRADETPEKLSGESSDDETTEPRELRGLITDGVPEPGDDPKRSIVSEMPDTEGE